MTNREWLKKIGVPDNIVVCDDQRDGSCHIMLRIAYDKQPWQTRKSIMIASAPHIGSEVQSLARWFNAEYDRDKILIGDDMIVDWIKN